MGNTDLYVINEFSFRSVFYALFCRIYTTLPLLMFSIKVLFCCMWCAVSVYQLKPNENFKDHIIIYTYHLVPTTYYIYIYKDKD